MYGSAGQGAFLLFHSKKLVIKIRKPEVRNNMTLYFDNKIRKGKLDISPANTAPAPIATNKAGNAQQTRVPRLVKRLIVGIIRTLLEIGFIFKYFFLYFQLHNLHPQKVEK